MTMVEVKGDKIVIDIIEFLKESGCTGETLAREVRCHLCARASSIIELQEILSDVRGSDLPRVLEMAEVDLEELGRLAEEEPQLIEKVDEFEQAMDDLANKFTALELYPVHLRGGSKPEVDFVDFVELYDLAQRTLGEHRSKLSRLSELLNIF